MGVCCGRRQIDEEINNAKDINEIIKIIEERKNKLPEERKELGIHLEDPTKQVGNLNKIMLILNGLKKEFLI